MGMAHIKTWFGDIELHNGEIVRSQVLKADIDAMTQRLQRENFADFDKECRGHLRKIAIKLQVVSSEREYVSLLRAVMILRAKERIVTAFAQPDARIIQLIGGIDDIDEAINLLTERLSEWCLLTSETSMPQDLLEAFATSPSAQSPLAREFAGSISQLCELRQEIANAIELEMNTTAPNLSTLAGELLGARLIARAGGLAPLARMPASRIQVIGASKALFRHMKYGTKPPKHGVIFQHPLVRGSHPNNRGKVARILAAKIAIAARLDFYSKKVHPELSSQVEKRVGELQTAEHNPKQHEDKTP
jgi:nucleolar protein 56